MALPLLAALVLLSQNTISPEGEKLSKFLDSLGVDRLWLAKHYVKWETGEALKREVTDGRSHTHCSAFAAAAAKQLGIYLLRPPEHSSTLLANAQYEWLPADGLKQGWSAIESAFAAQQEANRGKLVVAVYREKAKPGHVAIVRPSTKAADLIAIEGPQICQAGMTNYVSASLKDGFRNHKGAMKDGTLRYYGHAIDWTAVPVKTN